MSHIHLQMLPPSVNNLTVRAFLRATGLDHTEENAWGKTRTDAYMAKVPSHLTPAIETDAHPRGAMWESCAIMMYLCNKHGITGDLYPSDPGRRALVDSANFYLIGTLYPLVQKATYSRLGFGGYPGQVSTADVGDDLKERARAECEAAVAEPLNVFRSYFIRDGFIGDGDGPSIADIRLAATLEFMEVADQPIPDWAHAYKQRVEDALGDAYSTPASDVRGFLAQIKGS